MAAISSLPSLPSLTRLAVPLAPRAADPGVTPVAETQSSVAVTQTNKPLAQASSVDAPAKLQAQSSAKPMSKEELDRQVLALQAKMDKLNPALAFVVDEDSGRALLQITDRATKEVILQFPTEAALQISKALDQFQKGQLVSRTV